MYRGGMFLRVKIMWKTRKAGKQICLVDNLFFFFLIALDVTGDR